MGERKTNADEAGLVPTQELVKKGSPNGKADELLLTIYGVTVRDMEPYFTGLAGQVELFAGGVVEQLPKEWGSDPHDPETYRSMKFRNMVKLREAFTNALAAEKPAAIEGLSIDVWEITVAEMEQVDREYLPGMMAKYAVKVPKHWGAADEVDTYMNLPYPVWLAAQDVLLEAIKDLGKN